MKRNPRAELVAATKAMRGEMPTPGSTIDEQINYLQKTIDLYRWLAGVMRWEARAIVFMLAIAMGATFWCADYSAFFLVTAVMVFALFFLPRKIHC